MKQKTTCKQGIILSCKSCALSEQDGACGTWSKYTTVFVLNNAITN